MKERRNGGTSTGGLKITIRGCVVWYHMTYTLFPGSTKQVCIVLGIFISFNELLL